MKRYIVLVWVLTYMLSLSGCNVYRQEHVTEQDSEWQEHVTEEDGEQYLVLPISKEKVRISDEYDQHLDKLDIDLLKKAEEIINDEISHYQENSGYYLSVDDEGYLCLCVEVIVKIEPPVSTGDGEVYEESGCGIDHEHQFFRERIT